MRSIAVIVALVLAVFAADFAQVVFRILKFDRAAGSGEWVESSTVATFGYDSLRSGAVLSSLSARNYSPLTVHDLPFTKGSSHVMPIYLNGDQDFVPAGAQIEGRKVIYFGTENRFNAFDIEQNRIIWSLELPLREVGQTPVIDVRRGKIYFSASARTGAAPTKPWARQGLRIRLYSVNLDGSDLNGFDFELDALVYPGQSSDAVTPANIMRCRTSLGLNDHANSHYVFFGCGMDAKAAPHHYGNLRGARGVLIAAYLDDSGELLGRESVASFTPSEMGDNPLTGFDSGIWNTGSGPSLLPGNQLLVTTGNGPFVPQENNFGCSVVKLDGARLEPASDRGATFYSMDNRGFNECHVSNMDLASSSVSTIETRGQLYSAVVGKDGHLKVFNPEDLPGDDPDKKTEVLIGREVFGQPSMLLDPDGNVQVIAGGRLSYAFYRGGADYVTATLAQSEYLKKRGFRRGACIGLASSHERTGAPRLALHYSGHIRNDHLTLPMGTEVQAQITGGTFPVADWFEAAAANQTGSIGRYKFLEPVAFTLESDFNDPPPGYELAPLKLYAAMRGGLFSFPEALLRDQKFKFRSLAPRFFKAAPLRGRGSFPDEYGSVLLTRRADREGYCGNINDPAYERLYLFDIPEQDERAGWGMNAFSISDNYQLTKKWSYVRDDGTTHSHSNMVTTYTDGGDPGLVVFVVEDSSLSHLVLLNSQAGELIDQVGFSGRVHFSMPLIVDEKIYLATTDGIKLFRRSESFFELVHRFSLIW